MTKCPSCNGERSWWLLSNDKCLRSATARTLWKKGESSAPSVFHAFLGAICERALNLYVCRGGALWLAYHRTQTQSATQWECLFNPSTDIDSYYSLVLGKSALSVPDTRFSRVTGSTLMQTHRWVYKRLFRGSQDWVCACAHTLLPVWTQPILNHPPSITSIVWNNKHMYYYSVSMRHDWCWIKRVL